MKLRIEKAVYGGAGLARVPVGEAAHPGEAGKTIFVPMTLPGELVDAHITEDRNTFANAELDEVLESAPARTTPGCPYYGLCGGCHYQHATYPQQLEIKLAIFRETLERAGVVRTSSTSFNSTRASNIISAEPWGYRNRIRLHVRPASSGEPAALCYRQRGSRTLLRVEQCPIAAPVLVRTLQAIQRLPSSLSLDRLCREVEIFTNSEQDAVLLSLTTTGQAIDAADDLEHFCESINPTVPELQGASIFAEPSDALKPINASSNRTIIAKWGKQSLNYYAADYNYRVSTGAFFQTNRFLVDDLVHLVTSNYSGDLAWDLYAGVGLFARALTRSFKLVRAVEPAPISCSDLRHNLDGTRHKIVASTTLDFLRLQSATGAAKRPASHPDLVVVDPPRAGLGSKVSTLLASIAPHDIVYVSCDPATLARDLRALIQSGYQLHSTTLVDLFPQTFHMESVSRLSLR
ncbi:MAG TPA: 23S rRNA (uracil(1939)-C(5))-methyltransferase RlmD [Acidisarcina sp.]